MVKMKKNLKLWNNRMKQNKIDIESLLIKWDSVLWRHWAPYWADYWGDLRSDREEEREEEREEKEEEKWFLL